MLNILTQIEFRELGVRKICKFSNSNRPNISIKYLHRHTTNFVTYLLYYGEHIRNLFLISFFFGHDPEIEFQLRFNLFNDTGNTYIRPKRNIEVVIIISLYEQFICTVIVDFCSSTIHFATNKITTNN